MPKARPKITDTGGGTDKYRRKCTRIGQRGAGRLYAAAVSLAIHRTVRISMAQYPDDKYEVYRQQVR
jgi:hypothetical protein